MTVRTILTACIVGLLVLVTGIAHAQEMRPLTRENTTTIYQRILTRPNAPLHAEPDGAVIERLPAFQPFYVFARDGGWAQVGPSSNTAPTGWVAENTVMDWKQNIVAAFTNAADRQRSLLFTKEEKLRWFMEHEALRQMQPELINKADSGLLAPEDEIASIEPEGYINIREDLYLMPILDFVEELHPMTYEDNLLMKVASVPLNDELPDSVGASDGPGAGEFDAGVVFVFDTTQSMEPYIERTREALSKIIYGINGTDIGERINFGAYAFRDNTDAAPGLEYRTEEIIPLERRINQLPVLQAIADTDVAVVNSPGFNEDSLAGVEDAIANTDWDQSEGGDAFDGRYIILVTDAGPKDPRDPNARSPIGPVEIQRDAEGRNIVILTLHLKTDAGGEAQHGYAAARYRELSRFGQRQFYYPIESGSQEAFEATVTTLVTALTDHVRGALGEAAVLTDDEAGEDLVGLGHAIRLAWLGARDGMRAPDVIEGWVTEKAAENPLAMAIEPRLLVTKNEMATMGKLLENLVTLAEASRGEQDTSSFFTQVQSVIAEMATDPNVVLKQDASTLGGALEYLEQLPYRSQLLQIDERRWSESAMIRRGIIDGMRQKLTQYRKWLLDSSVWTALYEGAPDGEHVFAMPFDILP